MQALATRGKRTLSLEEVRALQARARARGKRVGKVQARRHVPPQVREVEVSEVHALGGDDEAPKAPNPNSLAAPNPNSLAAPNPNST